MDQTDLLSSAITQYLDRLADRGRGIGARARSETHLTYRSALRRFERFLRDERRKNTPTLNDLNVDDLAEFTRWLSRRYQGTTIQLSTTALKGFFRFLARRNALPFPLEQALAEYEEERPRFRYPVPEVVDAAPLIMQNHAARQPPVAAPDAPRRERLRYLGWLRDQALLHVLFSTGARISEALLLTRADVRHGRATMVLVHGKGDKQRPLQLQPEDQRAIRAYLDARQDTSAYLFISHAGRTPGAPLSRSYAWKLITGLAADTEAHGLSPHGIRRWLATMALRNGVDLKTISAALGHSTTAVTEQVYAFVAQEQVAERWGAAASALRQRTQAPEQDTDDGAA